MQQLASGGASAVPYLDFQEVPSRGAAQPSATHHSVGVVAVVLHAVLHQLLLVQVPGPAVWADEGRAVGNVARDGEDELRSLGKGLD